MWSSHVQYSVMPTAGSVLMCACKGSIVRPSVGSVLQWLTVNNSVRPSCGSLLRLLTAQVQNTEGLETETCAQTIRVSHYVMSVKCLVVDRFMLLVMIV